jgi:O-antigen ligase
MQNFIRSEQFREIVLKTGFFSLCATLVLISFPAVYSRYTLGVFIFSGFCLWLADSTSCTRIMRRYWLLILPPLVYFMLNIVSMIMQQGNIKLIEAQLMFLLIPVFGFPVLMDIYSTSRASWLFKSFIYGLSLVSLFLIFRIIVVFLSALPADQPVLDFLKQHNPDFVSLNFSVLEHPSYLSFKINFSLILLITSSKLFTISNPLKWGLFIVFSVMIFLLASKSGFIVWVAVCIFAVFSTLRHRNLKAFSYILIVLSLLVLTFLSLRKIDRINYFIVYSGRAIKQQDFDWKNLDQRTREWYTSISLIKNKPLTGYGIARIQDSMVEEYWRLGFNEEAELRMNAHNQFLEAQLTFGVAGTIILIWMLLTPLLFKRLQRFAFLSVPFVAMTCFFLFFESMFNRQWGIMFFLIFYLIIVLHDSPKPDSYAD